MEAGHESPCCKNGVCRARRRRVACRLRHERRHGRSASALPLQLRFATRGVRIDDARSRSDLSRTGGPLHGAVGHLHRARGNVRIAGYRHVHGSDVDLPRSGHHLRRARDDLPCATGDHDVARVAGHLPRSRRDVLRTARRARDASVAVACVQGSRPIAAGAPPNPAHCRLRESGTTRPLARRASWDN